MKKTAAILLIILYLFNWGGYRVVFYFMQQQTSNRLELKLDKNDYREDDLIEFSIPLHLPYQNDWADIERVDGEIVINGVLYHYVKRKVKDNHLLIKCIPNHEKNKLLIQQEAFFKSINDIQQDTGVNKKITGCEKISLSNSNDYLQQNTPQLNFYSSCSLQIKHNTCHNNNFETTGFFVTPKQPPETITA